MVPAGVGSSRFFPCDLTPDQEGESHENSDGLHLPRQACGWCDSRILNHLSVTFRLH
jgi:hypothetical protein